MELIVWTSVPSIGDETVSWGKNARQFFKEHDPKEYVRVGLFLRNAPLMLFCITQEDIPSLRFPTIQKPQSHAQQKPQSRSQQKRQRRAQQKRQRRAQRNSRILANIYMGASSP